MIGFGIGWLIKDNYPLALYDFTTAMLNFFAANMLMKKYGIKNILELNAMKNLINKLNSKIDGKEAKEVEESDGYEINTEINNIETTIEFLQSLSEEEQEKYLKLIK